MAMLQEGTTVEKRTFKMQEQSVSVSIIIPAFNAAGTVSETLESVLAQTMPNWEAIVIDDGSTDATPEIVASFARRDPRITVITQPNRGESAARNAGIGRARYNWILFLDSDDWIAPYHLERLTDEIRSNPDLDAVHCGSVRVALDGTQVVEKYLPPAGDMFATLARRAAFPVNACIVKRSLVEAVGKFDTMLKKSADWDLWQRIARTGARFGAVREVLAFYRMQPNSASLDAEQLLKDGLRVLRRGHSSDRRVHNPHPAHANGLPQNQIQNQAFYLLSWCAGLVLGCGRDARHLLKLVRTEHFEELYPPAVAQCLFEAATLPTCRSPKAWEELWYDIQPRVEEFLLALEAQSKAPQLAWRTITSLKKMVLRHSPNWAEIFEELEHEKDLLQEGRNNLQKLADERLQALSDQRTSFEQELERSRASFERERTNWEQVFIEQQQILDSQKTQIEALREQGTKLTAESSGLRKELTDLGNKLRLLEVERDELFHSEERRAGSLLLNRLKLRKPLGALKRTWSHSQHLLCLAQLAAERRLFAGRNGKHRVLAGVCDSFPIYSQTFVYQELMQLARHGFDVRLVYSKLDSRDYLPSDFYHLWDVKRRLHLSRKLHERDFERYQKRMSGKVESLIERLCEASGLTRDNLVEHGNFLQAFSFTRMVESYRPHYLHSYFFYDRSLMMLIASYLLGIPRGISCYADHLLKDYELKVVPLHLELCDVIIATSARVKQELIEIAPHVDAERIVIKPNAIDTARFVNFERSEPAEGSPFRLVTVSRIEPKKGLIDLVDAVHLLRKRGVPVEAHLVGTVDEWSLASRDYKRRLDSRISDLDLWGKVHLEGRQSSDGVLNFLCQSHLFVAPFVETANGDKDGIPTALLEGMATGLPVVATKAGSIPEVIEDGVDGILVSQHAPVELADAIECLLRDPGRRRRLSCKVAEKVRGSYDVTVCESVFHDRVRTVAISH